MDYVRYIILCMLLVSFGHVSIRFPQGQGKTDRKNRPNFYSAGDNKGERREAAVISISLKFSRLCRIYLLIIRVYTINYIVQRSFLPLLSCGKACKWLHRYSVKLLRLINQMSRPGLTRTSRNQIRIAKSEIRNKYK